MIRFLDSKQKNFNNLFDEYLLSRKKKIQFNSKSVIKIINDVKKNGDKALIRYEKKFNNNKSINLIRKKIKKSIIELDPKIKKSIDIKKYIVSYHLWNNSEIKFGFLLLSTIIYLFFQFFIKN